MENPWIRQKPTAKQEQFLKLDCLKALYGGAAGGAKSSCILMAALQYVDCPGYNAIILRRTYRDLALSGALIDRSKEWLTVRCLDVTHHWWMGALLMVYVEAPEVFWFGAGLFVDDLPDVPRRCRELLKSLNYPAEHLT